MCPHQRSRRLHPLLFASVFCLYAASPQVTAQWSCNSPVETFESGLPPAGWTITDSAQGTTWTDTTSCGEASNYTGATGDAACASSDLFGPGPFDTELRTPLFDLSTATAPRLRFKANYQSFAGSDRLDVDLSTDQGTSWTPLLTLRDDYGRFRSAPGETLEADLAPWAGRSGLMVRFRYHDPAEEAFDWYAQIDDVTLICQVPPLCGVDVRSRDRLADGGFEDAGPAWQTQSSRFGTPICTTASCGLAAARTGQAWAFFGGSSDQPESASLEQTVALHAGAARLSFYLRIPQSSGNDQDHLRVHVDGTEVGSAAAGDARFAGGWKRVEVDLSSFADGGSHLLRFEAETTGQPGHTNFFLDDVTLEGCPDLAAVPEVTVADGSAVETDAGSAALVLEVFLSHPWTSEVRVSYTTADGTATAGLDYEAASGMLVFAPGDTAGAITVPVLGDLAAEGDETFTLTVTGVSEAVVFDGEAVALLLDDDVELSISDVAVDEGDFGTSDAAFEVRLSHPSSREVTVIYSTVEVSAESGADFESTAGTLRLEPGQTSGTISVPVFGDTLDELDESFLVRLESPTAAKLADGEATGTIRDDETPEVSVGDASLDEAEAASAEMVFTVSLSSPHTAALTVDYATADGSASAGEDYLPVTGTLTFSSGQTAQTVLVRVLDDALDEASAETFLLTLFDPSFGVLGRPIGVGTIFDDDGVTADAGGPYSGTEGEPIVLDASGSFHPTGTIIAYDWDLDADGAFDDASGITAEATFPDDGIFEVRVRVSDESGDTDTAAAEVTVSNVAPAVELPPFPDAARDERLRLVASFADPGTQDTHTATIDWGDGTMASATLTQLGDMGTVSGFHTYTEEGTYAVEVCVSDDDGAPGCAARQVAVVTEVDLAVAEVDTGDLTTDTQTLAVTGTVRARIRNEGRSTARTGFSVLFFEDRDASGRFETGADLVLGEGAAAGPLTGGAVVDVFIPVEAMMLFAGNRVHAFADPFDVLSETDEADNVSHSGASCRRPEEAILEWSWTGSTVEPAFNNVLMTPIVADIDLDGVPDVLFNTRADLSGDVFEPAVLRAVRGDSGAPIFELSDPALRTQSASQIAVGDVDGDLLPEVVAVRFSPAGLIVLEHTGEVKWISEEVDPGAAAPVIANVDGVGLPEIVVGATVLDADGSVRWQVDDRAGGVSGFGGMTSVADLDLDATAEIVAGGRAWNHDGTVFFETGLADGLTALGDFDEDPNPEIVLVEGGWVRLLEHTGEPRWSLAPPGLVKGGPPTVADFGGDGRPEVGVAGRGAYVMVDSDGQLLWSAPIRDLSSAITGSSAFDFDGDGAAEVFYADELYLRIYRGRDGAVLFETPNPSCTVFENPVVADVDGDGSAEIVAARNQNCGFGSEVGVLDQGIFVFGDRAGRWAGARGVWNQHAYHVTNVEDDLSVPGVERPHWLEPGLNQDRAQRHSGGSPRAAAPDLTASWIRLDTSACPDAVGITARIGNGGSGGPGGPVDVAFYDGDPGAGGVLLATARTSRDLAPGELEDVAVVADPAGRPTVCVVVDGSAADGGADCRLDNNVACADFRTLCPAADLEITKTDGRKNVLPGSPTTYYIHVFNHGPSDVTAARVTDPLPESLLGPRWTCLPDSGAVCSPGPIEGDVDDLAELPAGTGMTYVVTATIDPGAVGTLRNTASVSSPLPDPRPGDETASDDTGLTNHADLTVTAVDAGGLVTDARTFEAAGIVEASLRNLGDEATASGFTVLFFVDRDGSSDFDPGSDFVLAEENVAFPLAAGEELVLSAAVVFTADFVGDLVHVFADSRDVVAEADEGNNVAHSGGACEFRPAPGDFSPVLEWAWTGSAVEPAFDDVLMTPIVADVNQDGVPDVLFNTREDLSGQLFRPGVLRVVDGATGTPIFELADPAYRTQSFGQIAVGDVDGDLRPEIVTARFSPAGLLVLEHTGEVKWFRGGLDPRIGAPAIANLDGVGLPEIVLGATVLDAAGEIRWQVDDLAGGILGFGGMTSVADLDLDGTAEVVAGGRAWNHDGSVFFDNGLGDGLSALGDFDADPNPEVVMVRDGWVRLLEHTGEVKWSVAPPGISRGGPPTVADFDGDGQPEVGVAGRHTYVVVDTGGQLLWSAETQDVTSSFTGSAVFDFEGDGSAEVLYNDEHFLRVFRGSDGAVLFETPNPSCTAFENPVVADVDADGNAEIVVARNQNCGLGQQIGIFDQGIFVYGDLSDNWVDTRRVWNQHAYHVTNVNDDLTVPPVEAPNWLEPGLNNDRAQAGSGHPLAAANLIVSLLPEEICSDPSTMVARIGNRGANLAAAPLDVAFFRGRPESGTLLGVVRTSAHLEPGGFEDVVLPLGSPLSGSDTLCVAVDRDAVGRGTVSECHETDNLVCTEVARLCAPPVTVAIDDVTVTESDPYALFTVSLSAPSPDPVTVAFETVDATAVAGADYQGIAGELVFAPGETRHTVAVPIVGDQILEELEETFHLRLSEAVGATLADEVGAGTILDDEECPGPNLLVNPGAEMRGLSRTAVPGWTSAASGWLRNLELPEPLQGRATFAAGRADFSELYQDVDVTAFAARIDAGIQPFEFEGFVRTFEETPPDVVRIVVEYRDATNSWVLEAFDSGEVTSPSQWHGVSDVTLAPAGTRFVRVRLLGSRFTGTDIDGFVDALGLRPRRVPALVIGDVTVYEQAGPAVFEVRLACAWEHEVTVSYVTADATALVVDDYLAVAGTLTFPVGTTSRTVPVPIAEDAVDEGAETFFVELSNAVSTGSPVLLDPTGVGTILNDDFCQRSHGFWKTHPEEWPVDHLVMGAVEYERAELEGFLSARGGDQTLHLALQLVATKLNLARGSDPHIVSVAAAADAFLEIHPPGSDPRGEPRREAEDLKDRLDGYNNASCRE